jgi:hypothetical protein
LILSIILVRQIGIYGVAWGTTIPSVIIELFLWPRLVCRLVAIPIRTYLWQTWFRTTLAVIPFAIGCVAADRFWRAPNLPAFFLQIAVLLLLLPPMLALTFRNELTAKARAWRKSRSTSDPLGNAYESSTTAVG